MKNPTDTNKVTNAPKEYDVSGSNLGVSNWHRIIALLWLKR